MKELKEIQRLLSVEWARCFATGGGPTRNRALENWHRQLKYDYLSTLTVTRLDVLICEVLCDAIDKATDNYCHAVSQLPHRKNQAAIKKSHEASKTIPPAHIWPIQDFRWQVRSDRDNFILYTVELILGNCDNFITCLKCRHCNVCHHTICCDCEDYILICKHCHAVVMANPHPQLEF